MGGSLEPLVLGLEETELKLGLPGERKRGFAEATADLRLGSSVGDDGVVGSDGKAPVAKSQIVGWPPVRPCRRNVKKSCKFVKVAVDGAPYLRKVDLEVYCSYDQLLTALEEMFSCFTTRNYSNERIIVDLVNGSEFVPTYEDKDGDWMLVGDVPWKMFVESCKRLRFMKRSEALNLAPSSPKGSTNAR